MRRTLDSMLLGRVLVAFVAVVAGLVVSTGASRAVASTRILIDFSGVTITGPGTTNPTTHAAAPNDPVNYWNNVEASTTPGTYTAGISNLVSTSGASTGIGLVVTDDFNPYYSDEGETGTGLYADNATYDYWWLVSYAADTFYNPSGTIELTGLSTDAAYDIRFYGGAARSDSLNRLGDYTATGANSGSVNNYDSYNNTTNVGLIAGIVPNSDGDIFFTMTAADSVDDASAFLNLLDITQETTPEPASGALLVLGVMGVLLRRRRA